MRTRRRDFLKITTAGATGLVLVRANQAFAAWPKTGTMEINPNISNRLVVACNDKTMMKSTPTTMSFATQNAAVDAARVAANMDAMAMKLADKTTADEAWKTIFRSKKAWESTVVAIKINCIETKNMARVAVLKKFSTVLMSLGVQPSNIIVYDGNTTYAGSYTTYKDSFSLTDTTKIQAVLSDFNDALGGTTNASLPDGSSASCTKYIADGTVDILINIANNKGHILHGGSTLCMKNHFGTFAANHTNLASYVLNINKSDAIVGGNPVRQQLCFIDSLFANKASNSGSPEVMPCYLIMGTFGPAVDYLTVKKVREAVMSCTHDAAIVNAFVTSFGYTTSDPEWVLVPPATSNADAGTNPPGDAGSGGTGTGGAKTGGTSGSGGAGPGGSSGTGGTGKGGTTGSGGRDGGVAGRDGGAAGSGGVSSGSGGTSSGGIGGGSGGKNTNTGGGAGTGGILGSGGKAAGGASGSGGAVASGGTGGGVAETGSSGCGCELGGSNRSLGGLGVLVAAGTLVAGQVGRLLARREAVASQDPSGTSGKATADEAGGKADDPT
jgi:hypothetical protein